MVDLTREKLIELRACGGAVVRISEIPYRTVHKAFDLVTQHAGKRSVDPYQLAGKRFDRHLADGGGHEAGLTLGHALGQYLVGGDPLGGARATGPRSR
jgi:hypothetical protein